MKYGVLTIIIEQLLREPIVIFDVNGCKQMDRTLNAIENVIKYNRL